VSRLVKTTQQDMEDILKGWAHHDWRYYCYHCNQCMFTDGSGEWICALCEHFEEEGGHLANKLNIEEANSHKARKDKVKVASLEEEPEDDKPSDKSEVDKEKKLDPDHHQHFYLGSCDHCKTLGPSYMPCAYCKWDQEDGVYDTPDEGVLLSFLSHGTSSLRPHGELLLLCASSV